MEIVDCFLDGYGGYKSNLVSFKIKPSNKYFFQRRKRWLCIKNFSLIINTFNNLQFVNVLWHLYSPIVVKISLVNSNLLEKTV